MPKECIDKQIRFFAKFSNEQKCAIKAVYNANILQTNSYKFKQGCYTFTISLIYLNFIYKKGYYIGIY